MSNLPESSPSSESNELMRVPTGSELVRQVESGLGLVKEVLREAEAEYWFELGVITLQKNEVLYARYCFDKAIEANHKWAEPYAQRSLAKYELIDYEYMVEDCEMTLFLNPFCATAFFGRGLANWSLETDLTIGYDIISDYSRALELDPRLDDAYAHRGILWQDYGELSFAENDFNSAISLQQKKSSHYELRANLKKRAGDIVGAEADFAKAAELERQAKQQAP